VLGVLYILGVCGVHVICFVGVLPPTSKSYALKPGLGKMQGETRRHLKSDISFPRCQH
jgi:hypothetical protein